MSDQGRSHITRRGFLHVGAALATAPILGVAASAWAQAKAPTKVLDFETRADVAKAEQEGEVIYYGHDGEAGIAVLLDAFRKDFPKIKTSYVRAQTGALYAKITAERSADRFGVDVLQLSDISPAIDFQKKGGWEQYVSPEYAAYKPEYQSTPAGYYGWAGVTFAGIAYNRSKVEAAAGAEDVEGHPEPGLQGRHQRQARDLRHAAHAVVHAPQALWRRLLAGVRQAAAQGLRLARPALRPARQGRRSRLRARRVRGLHPLQGEGRGDRLRGAARRAARDPRSSSGS